MDVSKVRDTKEKILSTIKSSGPSFPTRISREAGISPLFISALLAEMVSEKKLIMSSMKVGSSPIYLAPGQESSLENFIQYLGNKEREAALYLKEVKLIEDGLQDPAMRIALRKIKDFATPINANINGEEKLFWKFSTLSDEEAKKKIELTIPQKAQPEKQKDLTPVSSPVKQKKPREKTPKIASSAFVDTVKTHLQKKEIEILQDLTIKAKEYQAKIRIDTLFGKQEFLLIAKDKKKITEDDLTIALHKAQTEKLPSLLMAHGDLDKDAQTYLGSWKNLIKFEKLKVE